MNLTKQQVEAIAGVILRKQEAERTAKLNDFKNGIKGVEEEANRIISICDTLPSFVLGYKVNYKGVLETLINEEIKKNFSFPQKSKSEIIDELYIASIDATDMEQIKKQFGI